MGTVELLDDYTVYEGRDSHFMGQYSVSVKCLWKATALEVTYGHLIRGDSVWRTSTLTLDRVWVVGDADRRLAGAGRPVGGSDTFYRMIDSGHVAESPIGAATRILDNVIYSFTGTA